MTMLEILALACLGHVCLINLIQWLLLATSCRELWRPRGQATAAPADGERIRVVIPCYNERWHLPRLLDQLAVQTIADRLDVVVADDGSTDGTADVAAAKAGELHNKLAVTTLRLPRRGKGPAIDAALAHVDTPFVALMDADVQAPPASLAALRAALTPGIDAVSPLVVADCDTRPPGWFPRLLVRLQAIEYLRAIIWRPGWQRLGAAGGIEGRLGLFRTGALVAIGPFARMHIAVDYEISTALVRRARGRSHCLRTLAVEPIRTALPTTWTRFALQRRRWFLGLGDAHHRNSVVEMLKQRAYARAFEYLVRDIVHPWPFVEASWWVLLAAMLAAGQWHAAAVSAGLWTVLTMSALVQVLVARSLWYSRCPHIPDLPGVFSSALFASCWQPIRAAAVVTGMLRQPWLRQHLWSSEREDRGGLAPSSVRSGEARW